MNNTWDNTMVGAGYVRCPNNDDRWYHAWGGHKRPAYPMEIHVTDQICIVTRQYCQPQHFITLLRFSGVAALESYLDRYGVVVRGNGMNVWD